MRNAIILHGKPSKDEYYGEEKPSESNSHWIPWLQKQLIIQDIATATPEVPHSYLANWNAWKREVERYDIHEDTLLVGHSTGAGFWVRYLSERKDLKVGKVVLVAPWIDPHKTNAVEFFNFKIDPELAERTKGITIFNSDNDAQDIQKSVQVLWDAVDGMKVRRFRNYGHFCYQDMKTDKFPELLNECLS